MNFPQFRPPQQGQPQINQQRHFPRTPYPQTHGNQGFYYQPPQPQQFGNQGYMMPNVNPSYSMMPPYSQNNPQQQQVYLQEEIYQNPIQIASPANNQSSRFPQSVDNRRKKKENPTPTPPQPPMIPPNKRPSPIQPQYQYSNSSSKPQTIPNTQTNIDSLLPRPSNNNQIPQDFSNPPGCFNIVRRGHLPGISFSQICIA